VSRVAFDRSQSLQIDRQRKRAPRRTPVADCWVLDRGSRDLLLGRRLGPDGSHESRLPADNAKKLGRIGARGAGLRFGGPGEEESRIFSVFVRTGGPYLLSPAFFAAR
jgi:hypothetical protein